MKIKLNEKCLKRVQKLVVKFIKEKNKKWDEYDDDITKELRMDEKDAEVSVFLREDAIIINGEEGNNFSLYYVNYWEAMEQASEFMEWMGKHGVHLEWENPACMMCFDGDEK